MTLTGIFTEILVNLLLSPPVWTAKPGVIWFGKQPLGNPCTSTIWSMRCRPGRAGSPGGLKHVVSGGQKAKTSPQIPGTPKQPWQLSSAETTETLQPQPHASGAGSPAKKRHIRNYTVSHRFTARTSETLTYLYLPLINNKWHKPFFVRKTDLNPDLQYAPAHRDFVWYGGGNATSYSLYQVGLLTFFVLPTEGALTAITGNQITQRTII